MTAKPAVSVSIWNPKGGVGKTSFALALAGAFASTGQPTQLVDLDPQGGAMLWGKLAESEGRTPAFRVATTPAAGFAFTVYDHQPGLPQKGALPGALILVPTLLDKASYLPTLRGVQELEKGGKPYLVVPNRVEIASASQSALLATPTFSGRPYIRKRVAIQRAYDNGFTIYDEGSGIPLIADARRDFDGVVSALIGLAQRHAA